MNVTNNNTIVFQWQPLTNVNITKLAVIGYLLQCVSHDHTWQYSVCDPKLSIATVHTYQFLTTQQYSCSIAAFNPVGSGLYSDSVQLKVSGEH